MLLLEKRINPKLWLCGVNLIKPTNFFSFRLHNEYVSKGRIKQENNQSQKFWPRIKPAQVSFTYAWVSFMYAQASFTYAVYVFFISVLWYKNSIATLG